MLHYWHIDKRLRMSPDEIKVLKVAQRITSWFSSKLYYSIGKSYQRSWTVKRGEVFFVDLGQNIGSEENKTRPVVVIQSDAYNFRSPVFTCAIISSSPVTIADIQVPITGHYAYTDEKGITRHLQGAVDLGQIKTVAKERIKTQRICYLSQSEMNAIDSKLLNVLGLKNMLSSRDNTIASLQGKVEYLKSEIERLTKEQSDGII